MATMPLSSCSKDDPDPDNGQTVKPNETVADPTGTIQLSMRNNNETSLNGLKIGKDDNFHGDGWLLARVGEVNGLGNIYTIPAAGWTDKTSVLPGQGYVAYNRYDDEFYRLYVTEYILSATTQGVIGAEVKYQRPFKGMDEAIKTSDSKVAIPGEGGAVQVVFDNASIIPFKVTSSAAWCQVQKASTRDQWFLYDAIVISAEETLSGKEQTATVTIENLYGKETTIEVTRGAHGEFITPGRSSMSFSMSDTEQYNSVSVFTNVEPSDIVVKSDADWVTGELSDNYNAPRRTVRWVGDKAATRAVLEDPVEKFLNITCQPYRGASDREADITLSYGKLKETVHVTQTGSNFQLYSSEVEFEADQGLQQTVQYSGNVSYSQLGIVYESEKDSWVWAQFNSRGYITLTANRNVEETARTANLKVVYYFDKERSRYSELGTIKVSQKGMHYEDVYLYFESPASNYTVTFPVKDSSVVESTADWCTATPDNGGLVIRVSETSENRAAVISVSDFKYKIYVSQSKYKVNDAYSENGVEGTVGKMVNGEGIIVRYINENYAWSNEKVYISGASSYDDGIANTNAIHALPNWKNLYPAFAKVDELNVDGVTGWYLPAPNEFVGASLTWIWGNYLVKYYWTSCNTSAADAIFKRDVEENEGVSKSTTWQYIYIVAFHKFSYDFNKK